MRVAKLIVAAVFTLASGSAVLAQEDLDLDALLNDIDTESATAPAAEPMKGSEEAMDEMTGAQAEATDAVDTGILDMLETEDGGAADLMDDVAESADETADMAETAAADMPDDAPAGDMATAAAPAGEGSVMTAAEDLSAAEVVRLRAQELDGQERMKKGFDALSDRRYNDALADFEAALRLIPFRPANQDDLASARWGLAEAHTKIGEDLYKGHDYEGALQEAEDAMASVPNHRGAARLKRRASDRVGEGVYVQVRDRKEVVAQRKTVQDLLREGRDYFDNKMYDEAENLFEQVRVVDESNVQAMEYLKRIEDRRIKLANIERKRTVANMIEQVRDGWNPPIRRAIERPEEIKGSSEAPTDEDQTREELIAKMSRLIIPSIQFRDANILDVVEELRNQSEKADPEGLGVNIVLKLSGGAAAGAGGIANPATTSPNDFSNDPFFGAGNLGGGTAGGSGFGGGDFESDFGTPAGGFGPGDTGFGAGDTGFGEFGTPSPLDTGATSGSNVTTLTLTLRRISLLEALKIITEYADLKFKIENRIVFITPRNALTEPLETRVYAVQPSLLRVIVTSQGDDQQQTRSTGGGEFIELGTAKTITRTDPRLFFANAGVPFPPGTTIFYNEAISQLVVRNTIENLEIFERILPKFNVPPPQVEIEARFVEILNEDLQELGLEWILTDNYEIASNSSQGGLANRERIQIDANENGITSGLRYFSSGATGIEAAGKAGAGDAGFLGNLLSFSSVLTNPEINVVLHAIEQSGGSDLLSAPRIVTRSGVTASIEVVQEIIYPTEFTAESATSRIDIQDAQNADISTGIVIFPESFQTRQVGVILNVTPTVGPDNYTIDLSLSPEVAELVDWIQYGTPPFNIPQPIFASRNATTSIVIWDGQTVVMGGLINEDLLTFEDKIPFLGDIPLLGRLFRSKGERSVKRNLLIFVSARIVDPAGRPVNQSQAVAETVVTDPELAP